MRFYQKTLGGNLDALVKFGDLPDAKQMPPGSADKVMHAELSFGDGGSLMASDWVGNRPYEDEGLLDRTRLRDGERS